MNENKVLRTNLTVSIVLVIGFILTAVFSYRANYQSSIDSIEQISTLTAEGIYHKITDLFSGPVHVSLAMSHDSLLVSQLKAEADHLEDPEYIEILRNYLDIYQKRYGFDSVFLVSSATNRYYNFNGLDRVLTNGDPENSWYFDLLDSDVEYTMNVDNDEVIGADNEITAFVNCKVMDSGGNTLGVVGTGIKLDHIKDILKEYEEEYGVRASLISNDGTIEVSDEYSGYEKQDWFGIYGQEAIRKQVLEWDESSKNLEIWTNFGENGEKNYVVARYIPELSWSLLVEQNTGPLLIQIRRQLLQTGLILVGVVATVLIVITTVIRNFNRQIMELVGERQNVFQRATEQLYDNINELNITKNCYVGRRTEEYFERMGAKGLPYDQGLRVISEKQLKEEYREGYVSAFLPEQIIREYEAGNNHLQYDFEIMDVGEGEHWMRIDAYIFHSEEDNCLHMFVYRKNIDAEKQQEYQAMTDGMTGFYTKERTEHLIDQKLREETDSLFAFFIFDIDNFKNANDQFGHAFGDFCIQEFTGIIRKHFKKTDILGRIGGDEFAAFARVPDREWVKDKAAELAADLDIVCENGTVQWKMSASIGIAMAREDGEDFAGLYRRADEALYVTKLAGKNGFSFYDSGRGRK